jgi:predicted kinase
MANFYLVCGISGGGKTILSQRIIEKNPNIKLYDVDKYYALINGDECIHENCFDVWIKLYQDLHDSEIKNEDILLTTNALTVHQRNQFIEWFPTFNHHLLWVTAPKEKCIEGNQSIERKIPMEKLLNGWKRMEFPNADEYGWDSITQITNCWDHENYIIFSLKGDITELLKI